MRSAPVTAVASRVVSNTPFFFGSDPAEVRMGERKGLRLLAGEEDRGRALLGGARRGEKHYYRVQGDTFLIE